jgi:hypothetical protein
MIGDFMYLIRYYYLQKDMGGKYIINTPDFPRPTKVIVAEKVLNVAINTNKITQITISGHANILRYRLHKHLE